MATEKLRTIGSVFDYNFKYRRTWQPSHGQRATNLKHATRFMVDIHSKSMLVKDINQETMDIVRNWMYEHEDAANRTINYTCNNVANALNYCLERRRVAAPPEDYPSFNKKTDKWVFNQLPEKKVTKPIFTRDQVIHMYEWGKRLAKSAGSKYLNCAETILLTATTGVPWHEFVQIKAADVHLDNPDGPILWIGNRHDFNLKREVRERKIPLEGNAALMTPILQRRIHDTEGDKSCFLFGDDWEDHGKKGRDQMGRVFAGIRNDLGYEFDDRELRRTPYCLRHSFCTWSIQEGGCIERTRYLMGHSSIETTRGYLHLTNKDYVEAMPASREFQQLANAI